MLGGVPDQLGNLLFQQQGRNRYLDLLNQQTGQFTQEDCWYQSQFQNVRFVSVADPVQDEIDAFLSSLSSLNDVPSPVAPDPWYRRWYIGFLKWLLKVIP